MDKNIEIIQTENIRDRIFTIRNIQVMIDRDLAELYNVKTKALNQAVVRNIDRFPSLFRFQLTDIEKDELVTNCDRLKILKHSTVNPYAFTEQGVAMLSAVLRSDTAVKVSIQIMDAFVKMRRFLSLNAEIFSRINSVEQNLISYKTETDNKFEKIFDAIETKGITPKQGIFYNGQIFDAYSFVADLIKKANTSIILIDNYIDESVLTLLSKRKENVVVAIYTNDTSKIFKLDLKKYHAQYPIISIKPFSQSHDRFLIIDKKELYHFGASLKDLGKKWFAFSRMDSLTSDILIRIKHYEKQ